MGRQSVASEAARSVVAAIDSASNDLIALSHAIHADPELAFQEFRAATRLADKLAAEGFSVARGIAELPTAFSAELVLGDGATVAICAEYDALPDLGHGCGHNVIAAAAIGAALGIARSGVGLAGRLRIIGTPAEEGGGGKVILLDHGAFDGVDVAMMIHPATRNLVDRGSLASIRVGLTFHGVTAHADGPAEIGINALDAVVQTFQSVNAFRARLRPTARIHGIVEEGGRHPAIIPGKSIARFSVRAADRPYADWLLDQLRRCAEAAALATGTELEFTVARGYANMVPNRALARAFGRHLTALGRVVTPTTGRERMGSTDMGNVSQVVPAIHAYVAIAPEGTSGHSVALRDAAAEPAADQGVIDGAKALALTALDIWQEAELLSAIQGEFAEQQRRGLVVGFGDGSPT